MKFESLANETLLDLFEYISTVNLIRAISGLNNRFDNLLRYHLSIHSLDFRSISKTNFDFISQEYLQKHPDSIRSLHLSDNDETSQQINLFFSYIPTLHSFIYLRSLSLHHIYSTKLMEKFMIQWHYLPNLISLSIIDCYLQDYPLSFDALTKSIWSLSKLISCYLDIYSIYKKDFLASDILSPTIQYLTIKTLVCNYRELIELFRTTPCLKHLSIGDIQSDTNKDEISSITSSITKFQLTFSSSIDVFQNLLVSISNVTHLIVEIWNVTINGYQWEKLIKNFLPKLERFQFKMAIKFNRKNQIIDQFLDSFRTDFWINEHQWYVRYDWGPGIEFRYIYLYTLPYIYSYFPIYSTNIQSNSTYPYISDSKLYKHVRHLRYQYGTFKGLALSDVRFYHIQTLSIRLPISQDFWTVIPILNNLTSLTIWTDDQYHVQIILDHAPNLYSLTFVSWSTPRVPILDLKSKSIRRIDLQSNLRYFDRKQCIELSHSFIANQCQVLGIHLDKREDIIYLIQNMIDLRTLNIKCSEDRYSPDNNILYKDEFIEWLKAHLPSTCLIKRRNYSMYDIHIWIR